MIMMIFDVESMKSVLCELDVSYYKSVIYAKLDVIFGKSIYASGMVNIFLH